MSATRSATISPPSSPPSGTEPVDRAQFVAELFSGAPQYERFDRMTEIFPHVTMSASPNPLRFPQDAPIALPETFLRDGVPRETARLLAETETAALLVLHRGAVRFERYWLTGGEKVRWASMSVAKSLISAAVGIAVREGAIGGIDEPITAYVPVLCGSAYDGVAIRHVLQMSSGAGWNEDYGHPDSDINRFLRAFAGGGAFAGFVASLRREKVPGTYNLYNSADTQALGMLLAAATGRTIRDYVEEKLWHPLGAESDACWLVDGDGMEMAFGGLTATARDYARLGELYRLGGRWQGRQLVPAEWVKSSVTPDAPHLMPGPRATSGSVLGYGYQWWVMDGTEGEYSAIGVYNQFVYVNPARGVVIVKLSASRDYAAFGDESSWREMETMEFFRSIVRML